MKTFVFDEVKGKVQGELILIQAETAEEAFEKSHFTEKIRTSEKFPTMFPIKMYALYEWGKPYKVEYICR